MLNTAFRRVVRSLSLRARASRPDRRPPRSRPRPILELLEDRTVPATFTLTIPAASMSEAAGPNAVNAFLNRTGDLSQPLTVSLTSSDTTEATVPPSVSFAAGQSQAGFSISAVDDNVVDGTQTVTITATANFTQDVQPFGLDSSYGAGGLAQTGLDMAIQPPVQAMALQQDGKVIVASENGTNDGWFVQRFNTDGTRDTSFNGGLVNTPGLGSFSVPFAAIVQTDGKILIGGKVSSGTASAILVRYNSDGALDTSFGVGGKAALGGLGACWVTDVAVRPDGRILLGLGQNGGVTTRVAQLNADGSFDPTFGSSGVADLNLGYSATQVEVLADGTFLAGGSFRTPVEVARVNANGVGLVTSFGSNGLASLDFGTGGTAVAGMAVDAQGRIVVGADVFNFVNGNSTPADFAAGRLTPNGTPDATFAGDGTAVLAIGGSELATSLVVQQDGKVIVGGRTQGVTANVVDSAMARFNADGTPDATFDGDGFYRQSLVNTFPPDQITGMALQDDGKLLALTGWGNDWRIARFHLGEQDFTLTASGTIDVLDDDVANRPPVASDQSGSTDEDTPLTGALGAADADGDGLTFSAVTGPAHGTVQVDAATGAFTYTPAADYDGADSFTFKANDGKADSNVATVSITVLPVNDAPEARIDAFATDEDAAVTVPVLANDTDVDGDALTVTAATPGAHGTTAVNADGTVTYTPAPDFNGGDEFTYTVSDGHGGTATAAVTVTVTPVNDAPVAVNDSYAVDAGGVLKVGAPGVLANDTDVDGDALTAVLVAGPAHGTLSLEADGSFTYTPAAGFSGADSFTYRASDGPDGSPATVVIQVNPAAPTAGKLTGGGGLDRARRFNFDVQSRESAGGLAFLGQFVYEDRAQGLVLRSTSINYLRVEDDGVNATFRGTATVNGVAGYSFTVTMADRGERGVGNDSFRVRITGPGGFSYDSSDFALLGGLLDSGNIQVHKKKERA